jgi:hypothetical protein
MITDKIKQLQLKFEMVMSKKNYRMKSKIQTYDIRDCAEYYGVLELETLLKQSKNEKQF